MADTNSTRHERWKKRQTDAGRIQANFWIPSDKKGLFKAVAAALCDDVPVTIGAVSRDAEVEALRSKVRELEGALSMYRGVSSNASPVEEPTVSRDSSKEEEPTDHPHKRRKTKAEKLAEQFHATEHHVSVLYMKSAQPKVLNAAVISRLEGVFEGGTAEGVLWELLVERPDLKTGFSKVTVAEYPNGWVKSDPLYFSMASRTFKDPLAQADQRRSQATLKNIAECEKEIAAAHKDMKEHQGDHSGNGNTELFQDARKRYKDAKARKRELEAGL